MTSPWGKVAGPVETISFAEIMSEEHAHRLRSKEIKKIKKICDAADCEERTALKKTNAGEALWGDDVPSSSNVARDVTYSETAQLATVATAGGSEDEWEDYSELIKEAAKDAATKGEQLPSSSMDFVQQDADANPDSLVCDSDKLIAVMLQAQFDHEYNEELRRIEKQQNKQAKISVSLVKYRRSCDLEFLTGQGYYDDEEEEDEAESQKGDWDRFETNAKRLETIPKCGFKMDKDRGEVITKHDAELCGVRNACRAMALPLQFATGDGASFEMKLSNKVFNQLRSFSRTEAKKKRHDRRENWSTAEMGVDARTRLLLFKLVSGGNLEQINGIISTGKEAVILHANSDTSYSVIDSDNNHRSGALLPPEQMPKECAIKIFKTTLNEFKQRGSYIKDDYRFKERFGKQNNRVIINMWAEKEMSNLKRMQAVGINCPRVVALKHHVLVMSFIGDNHNAAPKLKDAGLTAAELRRAYTEVVENMHKLYNLAKLIHADLSEYNILWYDRKCWFIDVAQSVEPNHPSALEFLMRDCGNMIAFFEKRGLDDIFTKEQLFEHITALNGSQNIAMLERIHTRGANINEATVKPEVETCPDELKPLAYPFELAWEKSLVDKQKIKVDEAASAMRVLSFKCEGADESVQCEDNASDVIAESAKN